MAPQAKKYCPGCLQDRDSGLETCPVCKRRLIALPGEDLTGAVLDGRYRILGPIGAGGMGLVYRAKHEYIDRIVAVKVLRRDLTAEETAVKRFLLEAKASARLESPHTVTVHDFGVTGEGQLYLVMEYLDGKTLARVLAGEEVLHWRRACMLILQACESLREAHAAGIWHRDLKPENFMICTGDRGMELLKVVDFGIAKVAEAASAQGLTKDGMICGTPEYLSPEQAAGRELDHRTDIYSLGVVLYESLCGKPPFKATTPVRILLHHLGTTPTPIAEVNPSVQIPPRMVELVDRMMAKEPLDRPQSIEAVAAHLEAILAGERVQGTEGYPGLSTAERKHREQRTSLEVPGASSAEGKPFELEETEDADSESGESEWRMATPTEAEQAAVEVPAPDRSSFSQDLLGAGIRPSRNGLWAGLGAGAVVLTLLAVFASGAFLGGAGGEADARGETSTSPGNPTAVPPDVSPTPDILAEPRDTTKSDRRAHDAPAPTPDSTPEARSVPTDVTSTDELVPPSPDVTTEVAGDTTAETSHDSTGPTVGTDPPATERTERRPHKEPAHSGNKTGGRTGRESGDRPSEPKETPGKPADPKPGTDPIEGSTTKPGAGDFEEIPKSATEFEELPPGV